MADPVQGGAEIPSRATQTPFVFQGPSVTGFLLPTRMPKHGMPMVERKQFNLVGALQQRKECSGQAHPPS